VKNRADHSGFKHHHYTGKAIDISFIKERCTHVAACLRGEPRVFFEVRRPWVMPDLGEADTIADVVEKCPTGALHYQRNDGGPQEKAPETTMIETAMHGPLYLHGEITLRTTNGETLLEDTRVALCRCGKSKHFPFCDGRHHEVNFRNNGKIYGQHRTTEPGTGPMTVRVEKNKPYRINGPHRLVDWEGATKKTGDKCLLCSCGRSQNAPFCDGSHNKKSLLKRWLNKLKF